MNLVIDLGNTRAKAAVFNGSKLHDLIISKSLTKKLLVGLLKKYPINNSILSSVVNHSIVAENYLKSNSKYISFNTFEKLPIKIKYKSPKSLGSDRLVNAIAAYYLYPNTNVLIIDAGTCIKFDVINSKGEYIGGHIAPGLQMRFNALHKYTAKLPLLNVTNYNKLIGTTTEESIKTGVLTATLSEVEGMINRYKSEFNKLQIIVTGGNTSFFETNLKCSIFADENLLLKGLNQIIKNA